jgi:FAD/FMN-containing dehydrogenase
MDVSQLISDHDGEVLQAGEDGFDAGRLLWNVRFDRSPDLIVRCTNSADVKTAVDFAVSHGMALSVRGGGHSYAANSVGDRGVLVDLSPMKAVEVDADARTVTVQGGVTCAELDAATQLHGLATPTPTLSSVAHRLSMRARDPGRGLCCRTRQQRKDL